MAIGEVLKIIRTKLDLNQSEMADQLGVSQSFYSAVEGNRKPLSKKMLSTIAVKWGYDKAFFESSEVEQNFILNNDLGSSKTGSLKHLLMQRLRDKSIEKNERWQILNHSVRAKMRKVERYTQRIIDIKILLEQQFSIKERGNTFFEGGIINNVFNDESSGALRSEYSTEQELVIFDRELESLVEYLENRFFELFKILYNGLNIDLRKKYKLPEFID